MEHIKVLGLINDYHSILVRITPTMGGAIIPNVDGAGVRLVLEIENIPKEKWASYVSFIVRYMVAYYTSEEILGDIKRKQEVDNSG